MVPRSFQHPDRGTMNGKAKNLIYFLGFFALPFFANADYVSIQPAFDTKISKPSGIGNNGGFVYQATETKSVTDIALAIGKNTASLPDLRLYVVEYTSATNTSQFCGALSPASTLVASSTLVDSGMLESTARTVVFNLQEEFTMTAGKLYGFNFGDLTAVQTTYLDWYGTGAVSGMQMYQAWINPINCPTTNAPAFLINAWNTEYFETITLTPAIATTTSDLETIIRIQSTIADGWLQVCYYNPQAAVTTCEDGGVSLTTPTDILFPVSVATSGFRTLHVGRGPSLDTLAGYSGVRGRDYEQVVIGFGGLDPYTAVDTLGNLILSTTTNPTTQNCSGILGTLKCALSWAFVPDQESIDSFKALTLASSTPFGYIYDIPDVYDQILTATTSEWKLQIDFSTIQGQFGNTATSGVVTVFSACSVNNAFGEFAGNAYKNYILPLLIAAMWLGLGFLIYNTAHKYF